MKTVFSDSIDEKDSVIRKFRITAVNGKNDIVQKATVKNGLTVQGETGMTGEYTKEA
jgi:hypothetical protein